LLPVDDLTKFPPFANGKYNSNDQDTQFISELVKIVNVIDFVSSNN
ncbi:5482_t:CDS:1, partial [Scutellospora calospora]